MPEEKISGAVALRYNGIPLVDHHQLADRRLVAEVYENELAGDIVKDIITKYLASGRITPEALFKMALLLPGQFLTIFIRVNAWKNHELTGLQWLIRPDKSLCFF